MHKQKASPVDLALVDAGTHANRTDTELLAHIEGFAAVFEKTPPPSATAVLKVRRYRWPSRSSAAARNTVG